MSAPDPYRVSCLQLRLLGVVRTREEADRYHERALDYLTRTIGAVRRLKRQAELRLVVVPEFWLCGGPAEGSAYLEIGGVAIPGPLCADLGRLAAEHGVFIAANLVENASPAEAPSDGPFYDSCVLLDDRGRLALHYREVASAAHVRNPMVGPSLCAIGDEDDAGIVRRIMPTADTDLGRIGLLVGSDIRYGSLAALARTSGAEVIVHVANESEMCRDVWSLAKRVRSRETGCYLVSCNNGGYLDPVPTIGQTTWGGSRVLDPHGRALTMTLSTNETVVDATVDLALVAAVRANGAGSPLGVLSVDRERPSGTEPAAVPGPFGVTVHAAFGSIDASSDNLEDRMEFALSATTGGCGALGSLVVTERVELSGKGTRTFGVGATDTSEDVDYLVGDVVSLIGVGSGPDGVTCVGTARMTVGRGADAVRQLVADGSALLVVLTDGDVSDTQWQDLLDWARVAAWETEVHTVVLGNRVARRAPLPGSATARGRVLVQLSPTGDVMDVTELHEKPWRSLPFPLITTDADIELLTERRVVRRELVRLHDSIAGD